MLLSRPAYVHPSALSPSEFEGYAAWLEELESQISRLGRGLRIGEMLGFIRKRTPVERESEIMSYFGSGSQQQNMGVGEFIAILRLLAHARTCLTLTRDHIFIQTLPLVLTNPIHAPNSANPLFRTNDLDGKLHYTQRNKSSPSLQEIAATKKRVPLPPLQTSAPASASSPLATSHRQTSGMSDPAAHTATATARVVASPSTPLASGGSSNAHNAATTPTASNPFRNRVVSGNLAARPRQQPGTANAQSTSTGHQAGSHSHHDTATTTAGTSSGPSPPDMPPTPPESTTTFTVKSPPLPPRPSAKPQEPPPKHFTQTHTKSSGNASSTARAASSSDGMSHTITPSYIASLNRPSSASRPTGPAAVLDIITTSQLQANHTGQSTSSSLLLQPQHQQSTGGGKLAAASSGTKRTSSEGVKLIGSSHIGIDSRRLRAAPSPVPMGKHGSSSSEDLTLHRTRSESSFSNSSLSLPHRSGFHRSRVSNPATSKKSSAPPLPDDHDEEILSSAFTAPTATRSDRPVTAPVEPSLELDDRTESDLTRSKSLSATDASGKTRKEPPLPPPPRRRPESVHAGSSPTQKLVFGAQPGVNHPSPFTATSIQSSASASQDKHRHHPYPYGHNSHQRAASMSGSSGVTGAGSPSPSYAAGGERVGRNTGLTRHTSLSIPASVGGSGGRHKQALDSFIARGRDVSQEWLDKARANMSVNRSASAAVVAASTGPQNTGREDTQSLIGSDGRRRLKTASGGDPSSSSIAASPGTVNLVRRSASQQRPISMLSDDTDGSYFESGEDNAAEVASLVSAEEEGDGGGEALLSVKERKRELERLRTETEPGWSRLD